MLPPVVISWRSVLAAVEEPNRLVALLISGTGPVVPTEYCTAVRPVMNTALPLALMQVSVALPLPDWNRSPSRPPQPEVAPSGLLACQKLCWSLWLNNLGGRRTELAVYCALVVGWISVPTFSTTAIRPALQIGSSGLSVGASAYCRPPGSAAAGSSKVAVSASRLWARFERAA